MIVPFFTYYYLFYRFLGSNKIVSPKLGWQAPQSKNTLRLNRDFDLWVTFCMSQCWKKIARPKPSFAGLDSRSGNPFGIRIGAHSLCTVFNSSPPHPA